MAKNYIPVLADTNYYVKANPYVWLMFYDGDKNVITTEELYKYPLIMLSKEVIGNLYDKMLERVKMDGFKPMIEKTVDDIESEMFSIITDGFIGFAPESQNLSDYGDSIRMIPIDGSSHKYCIAAFNSAKVSTIT